MDTLLQDLRYAIRALLRQPSFALTAILTLALGIGATTAIFTVVNGVLLRRLPHPEPERIVAVTNLWTRSGVRSITVSAPDFHDWKTQSQSFESLAYYTGGQASVTVNGVANYVATYRVTPGFFETLGAQAAVGRLFSPEELQPGGPLAAVITDAFWKAQFGGDPAAVGSSVKARDQFFTIVGVLPPGVRYPARADAFVPAWIYPETTSRSAHN